MLSRIKIDRFKSLVGVEAELRPLTVVFGPNAAGKSNFLESLLLLSRLVTERTVAEALEPPMRGLPMEAFHLPAGGLPALLKEKSPRFQLEAELKLSGTTGSKRLRALTYDYRVSCGLEPRKGEVSVVDEYLARTGGTDSPRIEIDPEKERLLVRRKGGAGHPIYEQLPANHTQLSNPRLSGDEKYPDFDRVRDELTSWRFYYLDPREAMRAEQGPREVSDIGVRGESLAAFLFRLKNSNEYGNRFATVRRALSQVITGIDDLDVDLDERRGTLDIRVKQNGTDFSSRIASEGTLRLLALCCIAADPWGRSLVAFEEPENGVHPRRIELITKMLGNIAARPDRQVVVTTHSPTLVGEALKLQREDPHRVAMLVCGRDGRHTTLRTFEDPKGLFNDGAIRKSLSGDEDATLLNGMLNRGWLDD